MAKKNNKQPIPSSTLPKSPTGIQGLDKITGGGLPTGRPTLVCGSAGCGKTMLAMEFLVRGATEFEEPGVFMMFEENAAELTTNVRSLGFDLDRLAAEKKIVLDHIRKICEEHLLGRYDLEVIDIPQHPTLAAGEQIIAAPTLIKKLPLPLRRFIGDISKTERILLGLDLLKVADKPSS